MTYHKKEALQANLDAVRKYLMERSRLISTLRLPDGMFSENAGTEECSIFSPQHIAKILLRSSPLPLPT